MYYGGVKMNNHNVDVGEILDRLDWKKQVTKVYKCFKFHEVKKKEEQTLLRDTYKCGNLWNKAKE